MTISSTTAGPMPWWTEPTKDQWMAWVAAWLGWTLDAFDFTIFLLVSEGNSTEVGIKGGRHRYCVVASGVAPLRNR